MTTARSGLIGRWIGELFVIVVGVLIALGVDSWREDRVLRATEAEYLASLSADLRQDIAEYARASTAASLNEEAAWALERELRGGQISADSLAAVTTRACYFYVAAQSRVTIDDLTSTGNLQLLRDRVARRAVAEYYQEVEVWTQWVPTYRGVSDSCVAAVRGVLGPTTATRFQLGEPLELSETDRVRILSDLRGIPQLPGLLEGMITVQLRTRREHARLTATAEALLEMLHQAGSGPAGQQPR